MSGWKEEVAVQQTVLKTGVHQSASARTLESGSERRKVRREDEQRLGESSGAHPFFSPSLSALLTNRRPEDETRGKAAHKSQARICSSHSLTGSPYFTGNDYGT